MIETIQLSLTDAVRRVGRPGDEIDGWLAPAPPAPDRFRPGWDRIAALRLAGLS